MKNFTKLLLFLAFVLPNITFSQNEVAVATDYKTFASSANLEFTEKATADDLDFNSYHAVKDKCQTYKSMRTAGLVMTIVGPPVFVGGVILLFSSIFDEDYYDDDAGLGRAGLGLLGMGTGAVLTGAGVPLLIVGGIKSKKYCGAKGKSSMNLGVQKSGVGAALTF